MSQVFGSSLEIMWTEHCAAINDKETLRAESMIAYFL